MDNAPPPRWRVSPGSVALNTLAAGLLAPVLVLATFALVIRAVTDGRLFKGLAAVVSVLPADADTAGVCLVAVALGGLFLLVLACARLAWLFPVLLLGLGGLAETCIFAAVGLENLGSAWVLAPGLAGILLCALQVRRATRA